MIKASRIPLSRTHYVALLGILVVALGFRLNWLSTSICLIYDEAMSLVIATQSSFAEMVRITAHDLHPPLFFFCLSFWIEVFGTSEIALRSLSALFGVATVAVVWWYSYLWVGDDKRGLAPSTALVAAGLAAVNLPVAAMGYYARMYSMLTFFAILSAALLLKALQDPRKWRWWLGYAVAAATMIYTHYYGLMFVAGQVVWLVLECARKSQRESRKILLTRGAVAFLLLALLYAPWILIVQQQLTGVALGRNYWMKWDWNSLSILAYQFLSLPAGRLPAIPWYGVVAFLGATVAALWTWRGIAAERQLAFIILAHFFALTAADVIFHKTVATPRYFIYLFPLFFPVASYWLLRIPDRLTRNLAVSWAFVASVGIMIVAFLEYLPPPQGLREVARHIASRAATEDIVAVCPTSAGFYLSQRYYLDGAKAPQQCYIYRPDLESMRANEEKAYHLHSSCIRDEEFLRSNDIKSFEGGDIWVISEGWPRSLEDTDWQLVSRVDYRGVYPTWEAPIYISHFHRIARSAALRSDLPASADQENTRTAQKTH